MEQVNIFWFRRDLRMHDNTGLEAALNAELPLLPLFIFDTHILDELPNDDPRVTFIYDQLTALRISGLNLVIRKGSPLDVFKQLAQEVSFAGVYCNRDYEPYARQRDQEIRGWLQSRGIPFHDFKDQVIFVQDEVVNGEGKAYTVYTPYKNAWLRLYKTQDLRPKTQIRPKTQDLGHKTSHQSLVTSHQSLVTSHQSPVTSHQSLKELGFVRSSIAVKPFTLEHLGRYEEFRDFPWRDAGSYLSVHLRFGTVSIREIVAIAVDQNLTFREELIWREFFMQILWHFPEVVQHNFKRQYDRVQWRNNPQEFEKWCRGETGFPMVDAGMRELNQTGYMHNRVRMITASFLCKHLLIDWRWGEAFFAGKLLDYELSSNNGNWQWAAGTGCDAAPYFRVFNPETQQQKFDPEGLYLKKWVPEYGTVAYPPPMTDHKTARLRALDTYKAALNQG